MVPKVRHSPQAASLVRMNSYLQPVKSLFLESVSPWAGWWSADGLSFSSTPTTACERPATPSTPNKPPHLRNWISFRVRFNLSQMISILTHVPAGPTPEAKAEIAWCKITEAHCQVDIRIGMVGRSGRGNVMSLSRFDKLAGQYHSQ